MFPRNYFNRNYYFNNRGNWYPQQNQYLYYPQQIQNGRQSAYNYWNFDYSRSPYEYGRRNDYNPVNEVDNIGTYNPANRPPFSKENAVLKKPERTSTPSNNIEIIPENSEKHTSNFSENDLQDAKNPERDMEKILDSDVDTVILDEDSTSKSNFLSLNVGLIDKNKSYLSFTKVQPNSDFSQDTSEKKDLEETSKVERRKVTRRKSAAGREFSPTRVAKRKVQTASISYNNLYEIDPSSMITRSQLRKKEVLPSNKEIDIRGDIRDSEIIPDMKGQKEYSQQPKFIVDTSEKNPPRPISACAIKTNGEANLHLVTRDPRLQNRDELKLKSSSATNNNNNQSINKRLEALFGKEDSNSPPKNGEQTETVKATLVPAKKRVMSSSSDADTASLATSSGCNANGKNPKESDTKTKRKHDLGENQKVVKKRKYEKKHSSNKRKGAEDKLSTKNGKLFNATDCRTQTKHTSKLENNEHIHKKIKSSSSVRVEPMEEGVVLLSIPEIGVPKSAQPLVHNQLISPSCISISQITSKLLRDDQIHVIDLVNKPDTVEILLVKTERGVEEDNCTKNTSQHAPVTGDGDIFDFLPGSNSTSDHIVENYVEVPYSSNPNNDQTTSDILQINSETSEDSPILVAFQHHKIKFSQAQTEDVKPALHGEESIILIEDDCVEPVKIDYLDFATMFVDDFYYYRFVQNYVYEFSVNTLISTDMSENKYSEMFDSRKLIFARISKKILDYVNAHEILHFDCKKLLTEINAAFLAKYKSAISNSKILHFLHDIVLTWQDTGNSFMKHFSNSISHHMMLYRMEGDNDNRPPKSIISSTCEVSNDTASSPQAVTVAQPTNQSTTIATRPIEELLANPQQPISSSTLPLDNNLSIPEPHHQSPHVLTSQSQSPTNIENVIKELDSQLENSRLSNQQKILHTRLTSPTSSTLSQGVSNETTLPQSIARNDALLRPPSYQTAYENYAEQNKALSQKSKQSAANKRRLAKKITNKIQNQGSLHLQNSPHLTQYPQSPIWSLHQMISTTRPSIHPHTNNRILPQQLPNNLATNTYYPRYPQPQRLQFQPVNTNSAQLNQLQEQVQNTLPTYTPRYTTFQEELENQIRQELQLRGSARPVTTLSEHLSNDNLYFHGHHLENQTQQQRAHSQYQQPGQLTHLRDQLTVQSTQSQHQETAPLTQSQHQVAVQLAQSQHQVAAQTPPSQHQVAAQTPPSQHQVAAQSPPSQLQVALQLSRLQHQIAAQSQDQVAAQLPPSQHQVDIQSTQSQNLMTYPRQTEVHTSQPRILQSNTTSKFSPLHPNAVSGPRIVAQNLLQKSPQNRSINCTPRPLSAGVAECTSTTKTPDLPNNVLVTNVVIKPEVVPKNIDTTECIVIDDNDEDASTEEPLCYNCNQTALFLCSCKKAFYCSINCQRTDWSSHKLACE